MAIVALTNSSSPVTVERATADSDPYERETQLNGLALNFDAHDHTSAKGLAVGRLQAPAVSGVMTFEGDATLSRTGPGALRADTHLGVGVNPAAWNAAIRVVQVGVAGALQGQPGAVGVSLSDNTVYTATPDSRALTTGEASSLNQSAGALAFLTAPSVAGGAAQTFTERLRVARTGTLALTPDAAAHALTWTASAGAGRLGQGDFGTATVEATSGNLQLRAQAGAVFPAPDNTLALGGPATRWTTVYATVGAINTSSRTVKEGITPLDPAACYQAAKDVRWYEFAYLPPAYQEPEPSPDVAYDEHDDNDTKAEKKALRDEAEAQAKAAHLRMVAETAPARHQRGFVFPAGAESKDEAGSTLPPVPELFGLSDRESTTPQADIATLGCAFQELVRLFDALVSRVAALEGAA